MTFGNDRKNCAVLLFGGKRSCLKRIRGYGTGLKEVGVATPFLGNDGAVLLPK